MSKYTLAMFLSLVFPGFAYAQFAELPGANKTSNFRSLDISKGISIARTNADPSGNRDSTSAINKLLADLGNAGGGLVTIPSNSFYLIKSNDLLIPANVRIIGESSPFSGGAYTRRHGSGFILDPAHTIMLGQGTQLTNIAVVRANLVENPTISEVLAAVKQWGAENSIGITLPANVGGQTLRNIFIVGFNTAIKASVGQFSMQRIAGDDFNGLEVKTAGDNHYIDDIRFEPFYAMNTPASSGSWARPGVAFNLHDGNTGTVLTRAFSFMYANGIIFDSVGVTQVTNSGFEWSNANGNGTSGTKGIRWINHNAQTSISNTYSNGFDVAYSDEGEGEVMISSPSTIANTLHFYLGGRLIKQDLVFVGKPVAGQTLSLLLSNLHNKDNTYLIKYSVRATDKLGDITLALATIINHDKTLEKDNIYAKPGSDSLTIFSPLEASGKALVISSDATFKLNLRTTSIGSYGMISNADVNDAGDSKVFYVGPYNNGWIINVPFLSNGRPSPSAYDIDPTSRSAVRIVPTSISNISPKTPVCPSETSAEWTSCGDVTLTGIAKASSGLKIARRTVNSGTIDTATAADIVIAWRSTDASEKRELIPGCSNATDETVLIIKDELRTAKNFGIIVKPVSGTIEGKLIYVISADGGSVRLICDGSSTNWMQF